ncbi:Por secretion system C-terminal sorting domain-containing protein [Chryseobacterium ureilyticum]|uniref:Por secretion system C-terminal sorting domain-containing protein n=1 Tax=Chryseobacterium ureilyticum TaxID=373668 RepID=A0A1N7PIX8_9FLAO|nr:S8 family peptidase [Chryseobacterium ureilyticum]SIT10457.1 Por secretion system C-terminal sorting domain-containing protein [Chryseobacterium ureilyticum]
MKKIFISISVFALTLANAQQKNETLMKEFEKQRIENNKKFDAYVAKRYGSNKNPETLKEIDELKTSLAGFTDSNKPYFYKVHDMDQIKNSNSDYLQGGNITGLTGSFNGENIKFTIFDGSTVSGNARVYANHTLFNNAPGRITNKESSNLNYGDHATAVASFIGARDFPYTFPQNGRQVNFKGIAPNCTIDAYSFGNSILQGETTSKNVFEKILTAQPNISNHSYGISAGWDVIEVNNTQAWGWHGSFTPSNTTYDMQGSYILNDRLYDLLVYSDPSYIIIKSAGNSFGMGSNAYLPATANFKKYYVNTGSWVEFATTDTPPAVNCAQGYDCISPGSVAKNIISVAASDRITANNGRYIASADVIHSSYSSAGPRDDGGIKPDITAVGTNVASATTGNDSVGSNGVAIGSGTSYSAPIVTGIIGLWTQINKQLFSGSLLNAASAKTLMIHSALEAGSNPGPDAQFGWGFINAKKGAELLVGKSNNTIIFNDEVLTSGTSNKKTVVASGSEPLKVTISWVDPEYPNVDNNTSLANLNNNRISKLMNDLDLRIIDASNNIVYLPWRLDYNNPLTALKGDNTVDNVEQVIVDNPVAGRNYRIEITNKGILRNNSNENAPQNYSIIVTGHSELLGTKDSKAGALSNLIISPSVTKDVTNILKAPKKSAFIIYDMSGKKLQSGTINSEKETIDLSTYTKGIYIIEIKTDNDIITKKVIKE